MVLSRGVHRVLAVVMLLFLTIVPLALAGPLAGPPLIGLIGLLALTVGLAALIFGAGRRSMWRARRVIAVVALACIALLLFLPAVAFAAPLDAQTDLGTQVTTAFIDLFLAALSLGTAYATLYIAKLKARADAEAKGINDENLRQLVLAANDRVDDLATRTVEKIEQTVAADLRQAVKDGKADRASLLALGKQAAEEVYGQLSTDTINLLKTEVQDVQAYVQATIESKVREIKTTSPGAAPATA